jgi:hypothetical protein
MAIPPLERVIMTSTRKVYLVTFCSAFALTLGASHFAYGRALFLAGALLMILCFPSFVATMQSLVNSRINRLRQIKQVKR